MANSSDSIFNIGVPVAQDNSIVKKEFYPYTPYTNTFENSQEIRIAIQNSDAYLLPHESYLYIKVKVITTNHVATAATKVKFAHNFASFLFSEARYELNGFTIDRIRNVGITSTMKLAAAASTSNMLGYYNFNAAFTGRDAEFSKDLYYDVCIPLSAWFGFCDDYRKIVLNSRHELILIRSRNSLNCVYSGLEASGSAEVKIEIAQLEWMMPHVTMADNIKSNMISFVGRNKDIQIQHRSWELSEYPELPQSTSHIWSVKTVAHSNKPRYVLVGFQTNKSDNRLEDATKFSGLDINCLRLYLNSQVYPYYAHQFDIPAGMFGELYNYYANIQQSYYNGVENRNLFEIDFKKFQTNVIFAFDTSRADETVNQGGVDIRIEYRASKNIPAKTSAFCLLIYDNEYIYSPFDGTVAKII